MNIWWINHYAVGPSHVGGTRHYSLGRELVRCGHDVTIVAASFNHFAHSAVALAPGASCRVESVDGVRFVWLRSLPYDRSGAKRLWSMLRFARAVRSVRSGESVPAPDIILGSSPHPFAALAACRLAERYAVPFVLEVRDLWPRTLIELGGLSPRHPLVVWLDRIEHTLYGKAASVISVLPGLGEHIAAHGGDAGKVVWVPNGIDLELLPRPSPRPVESPSASRFTVMYAGSHGPANALDTVLDAARRVERSAVPVAFVLVGDGPEKERLRRRAEAEGLHHVRFEAPRPKRDLYALLASADAFVATLRNSPLYRSGMSLNKLFDYLALGRPTIFGADVERNPIAESGAGFVVPPEDGAAMAAALTQLAALDGNERAEMGRKGRAYVELHHNCARLAERLSTNLEEVASRS